MLSVTTMVSVWCAYQSKRWGGTQRLQRAGASSASQKASKAHIEAIQLRTFDAAMLVNYIQAKLDGNERQERFLFDHLRPETKKAVEAWLKTEPFSNPRAPQGPLQMPEYVQPELAEAQRQEERAGEHSAAAQDALHTSENYVLLTVLCSTVLFFGGLSATVDRFRLRVFFLTLALTLFVGTILFLATLPMCHG
jgi:hypothetical protein